MSNLYFLYERAVIVFAMAVILNMIPVNTLAADVTDMKTIQQKGNDKAGKASVDKAQVESDYIDLEAQLPKRSYKIDEPIILKISIRNRTSYDLHYLDWLLTVANFEISIREKKLGDLPPNEFGIRLTQPHGVGLFARMGFRVKPGEVKNYDLALREIFDLGVGSYEVTARRQLFLLDKKSRIELTANPIQFDVTK